MWQVRMPHNNQVVEVRIGIHTGSCVTGLVGTKVPKVLLLCWVSVIGSMDGPDRI
jgi:class 3 adenylate cyclase